MRKYKIYIKKKSKKMCFKEDSRRGERIKKSLIETLKLALLKKSFGKSSKRIRK